MAKKIVQDILPNEGRTVRKVVMQREKKPTRLVEEEVRDLEEDTDELEEKIVRRKAPAKKVHAQYSSKYLISFIVIFVAITIIAIALSLSYSKAVVTITPKVVSLSIDGTFTAKKSLPDNTSELSYEVISASDSESQTISAVKGPLVQTKAKGTVILYNNYSATAQTLVAGTRLASTNGLVYRTTGTIIIPGKKTAPGSISVTVVADQPGENYNLKRLDLKGDFKLPGYKGTPKYDGFYARLKTDITGGFLGNKMTIDPASKTASIKSIQESLKESLLAKLIQNTPKENIFYDQSYVIEYDTPEPVMQGTSTAKVTVKGTAYGAIFNRKSLIQFIAGKEIKKFPSDTYLIEGDNELSFKISNIKDFSPKKGTSMIFTLKGPVKVTGTFSEEKLKNELKGIKLIDSNAVFAKYTSIANAYALITPFWLRSFPDSINKINIEYKH
jgi:hypothetical protein